MYRIAALIAAGVLAFSVSTAHAVIKVGDQAVLTYQTVDGKNVDLQKLHGKIVIVDFWATWCGPCMAEAPHMVSLNEKYGSKGLVMLGISLDSDKAQMLAVAKTKGFAWPQYFDGKGWENTVWKQWGESGIPFTVLIDPNGKVQYVGHPAGGLDAALDSTFKTTPPFLVDPSIVADATKVLDDVESKLAANDAKGAMKSFAKVPAAAKADDKIADRQKEVEAKLTQAAESALAEVDPLVSAGNYSEAISKLRDVSAGFAASPIGAKAKKQLTDLMAKPEVKAAMAKADKEARDADKQAKAADALAEAKKLKDAQDDAHAYIAFKAVVATYAGTPSAQAAAAEVAAYDQKSPDVAAKANEAAAAGKAKAALSLAATYERQGDVDKARDKYKSIIEAYPGTSFAKKAQDRLTQLATGQ